MNVRAAVEARLRDLDSHAGAALVADLWAARGYETTLEGGEVVATAGDESFTVHVAEAGKELRRPPAEGDVVVALDTRGWDVASDHGGRVLDATDLAEMLLYAVDLETRTALCRRHFGSSPEALSGSRGAALEDRLLSLTAWQSPTKTALVVFLLVIGATAVAGLTVGPGPDGGLDRTGTTPTSVGTPVAVPSLTPTPATGVTTVPGLTPDGVENLTALALAHERFLGRLSFTFTAWVDLYRPRDGDPNATRIQRDVDVSVATDRSLVVASVEDDTGRRPVLTMYTDGRSRYVAEATDEGTRYRRLGPDDPSPMAVPGPQALRRDVVVQYLSTPNTTVDTRIRRGGWLGYRVTGTGAPTAPGLENVVNYSVVAFVTEDGFVRELVAEYEVPTDEGTYPVRFEVSYDRLGQTTASSPPWYEREFGENTTTATDSGT